MADVFKLKIEGLKELKNAFRELDAEFSDILADAVSEAAAVVEREAKLNSERGGDNFPHRITGNLMNSIKEIRVTKKKYYVESQVGSDMVYAPRLEFGFVGTDKLGRRYNQRPRPYLRPALDENTVQIQKAFQLKVDNLLRRYR
jgi:HK97 gp10 family phage protein